MLRYVRDWEFIMAKSSNYKVKVVRYLDRLDEVRLDSERSLR